MANEDMTAEEKAKTAESMFNDIAGEVYFGFNLKCELLELMDKNTEAYDHMANFFYNVKYKREKANG